MIIWYGIEQLISIIRLEKIYNIQKQASVCSMLSPNVRSDIFKTPS